MNLLLILLLAFPFFCLALLSLTALLGVLALGGAISVLDCHWVFRGCTAVR